MPTYRSRYRKITEKSSVDGALKILRSQSPMSYSLLLVFF